MLPVSSRSSLTLKNIIPPNENLANIYIDLIRQPKDPNWPTVPSFLLGNTYSKWNWFCILGPQQYFSLHKKITFCHFFWHFLLGIGYIETSFSYRFYLRQGQQRFSGLALFVSVSSLLESWLASLTRRGRIPPLPPPLPSIPSMTLISQKCLSGKQRVNHIMPPNETTIYKNWRQNWQQVVKYEFV